LLDEKREEMASIIGAFVRKNRKSLGLTSDKVSEICKVDNSTLSQIENGRRVPKLETIVRIVGCFIRYAKNSEKDRLLKSIEDLFQQLGSIYEEVG